MEASLTASFNSLTSLAFSRGTTYLGAKSCSTSTPSWLFGKSRTWPNEAMRLYDLPKILPIVFAFAGDSTITKFALLIALLHLHPIRFPYFAGQHIIHAAHLFHQSLDFHNSKAAANCRYCQAAAAADLVDMERFGTQLLEK